MRPVDSRREPLPRHGAPSTHFREGLGPATGSATDDQRRSRGPSLLGIPGGLAIGIAGGRIGGRVILPDLGEPCLLSPPGALLPAATPLERERDVPAVTTPDGRPDRFAEAAVLGIVRVDDAMGEACHRLDRAGGIGRRAATSRTPGIGELHRCPGEDYARRGRQRGMAGLVMRQSSQDASDRADDVIGNAGIVQDDGLDAPGGSQHFGRDRQRPPPVR
jgi:hypothetical protein